MPSPGVSILSLYSLNPLADTEGRDLALDQPLARLRQGPLRLANADGQRAAFRLAGLDQKLSEKV